MANDDAHSASDTREYPARPICAVGAIVRRDDTVLLIRRGKPPRAGEWTVPGGALELGETMVQAVEREIREECGIEIIIENVAAAVDIILPDAAGKIQFQYAIIDFAARYGGGDLHAASDVAEARWVPLNELKQYTLIGETHEVILKVFGLGATTNAT